MNRYDDDRYLRQDDDYQGGMRPADWENEPGFERGPGPLNRNRLGGIFGQGSSGRWESGDYEREGGFGAARRQPSEMVNRPGGGWTEPYRALQGGPRWDEHEMQRRADFRNRYGSPQQAAYASVDSGPAGPGWGSGRNAMDMGAGLGQAAGWTGGEGMHAGRGPRGYRRADERIHEDVCEALTCHGWVDASDIEVSVHEGEVTLRGTVDDRRQKRLAEEVAESCSGVHDVHNQIRVRGVQGSNTDAGSTGAVLQESKAEDLRPARAATRGSGRTR